MPILGLNVDNLKCGGCASTVRRRLNELPGVVSTSVDVNNGTVTVAHDGTIDRSAITLLLQKLGYPLSGTGGITEKARSFVSCAIGRMHGEQ
ncbi:MAG: heavy-metal-associated domain-containing protein [Flavobacteriales bacterium]|jgi:copper chaperone|nr:heavy-metal-associated domain-containing protein [Flavobacteriales bacterium]